jgi:hypothetical protein
MDAGNGDARGPCASAEVAHNTVNNIGNATWVLRILAIAKVHPQLNSQSTSTKKIHSM